MLRIIISFNSWHLSENIACMRRKKAGHHSELERYTSDSTSKQSCSFMNKTGNVLMKYIVQAANKSLLK